MFHLEPSLNFASYHNSNRTCVDKSLFTFTAVLLPFSRHPPPSLPSITSLSLPTINHLIRGSIKRERGGGSMVVVFSYRSLPFPTFPPLLIYSLVSQNERESRVNGESQTLPLHLFTYRPHVGSRAHHKQRPFPLPQPSLLLSPPSFAFRME